MCGATLSDKEELQHHNEQMHPNMVGKKGGEVDKDAGKPSGEPRGRPID